MSKNQAVWYVSDSDNQPAGPHTTDQVLELCREGKLDRTTLCWQEGMDGWKPLPEIQPFCEVLPETSPATDTADTEAQGFEDLGKMFGKAISLTKKKAKIVSLKMSIGKHEKRMHQIFFELGKMLYEKDSDSEMLSQPPYAEKIHQARLHDKSIQALREEIKAIENTGHVDPQSQNPQD